MDQKQRASWQLSLIASGGEVDCIAYLMAEELRHAGVAETIIDQAIQAGARNQAQFGLAWLTAADAADLAAILEGGDTGQQPG